MKRIIVKYWWVLPLLLLACMLGLTFLFSIAPTVFESIVCLWLLVVVVLLPVSWVILLVNKKWWQSLLSFVLSAIVVLVLWAPLVFGAMSGPDGFGREHKIPEGLEYQLPLDADAGKGQPVDSLDRENYLQIWNGCQGGIYLYDFYYPALPAGEIFLRCYEATENIPLSEGSLPKRSPVSIGATRSFSQLVKQQEFVIFEGDWGDYYAARFEVWFRDADTGQETKLCEKVYRIEGWMR